MKLYNLAVALLATGVMACAQNPQANAQSVEEFAIDSPAGYTLAGEIQYPDQIVAPGPAIVLISGSGAQDRDAAVDALGYSAHRQWRDILNAAGFAVITYDETGTGQSGGEWTEMGLEEHRDNALATIALARRDQRINPDQIYALGHSEGGLIISMMSIADAEIAGLVYVAAPGADLQDVIDYQTAEMARAQISDESEFEAAQAEMRVRFMQMLNNAASLRDGLRFDALELAQSVQAPSIVIQGLSDWQVRAEQATALGQALQASGYPVEIALFGDVNHFLVNDPTHSQDYSELTDMTLDTRLSERVVDWLSDQTAE